MTIYILYVRAGSVLLPLCYTLTEDEMCRHVAINDLTYYLYCEDDLVIRPVLIKPAERKNYIHAHEYFRLLK